MEATLAKHNIVKRSEIIASVLTETTDDNFKETIDQHVNQGKLTLSDVSSIKAAKENGFDQVTKIAQDIVSGTYSVSEEEKQTAEEYLTKSQELKDLEAKLLAK